MIITKAKKRFTLVELIIVVVVIGLLAGLAIPKFINVQRDANVASLYRDIDTLESIIPVYYNDTDQYPVGGQITLIDGSDIQKAITSTGDSGTQLFKVDLNKTQKYHSKLRHGYSGQANDYFIYSKESGQVFFANGISNGHGELVFGNYNSIIRNVVLGTTPLSINNETQVVAGSYTIKGEVLQNETVKVTINGTEVPVTYNSIGFEGKNIFAGNNDYKTFTANMTLVNNSTNTIVVNTSKENMKFKVKATENPNHSPVPTIVMTPEQGLTTSTNINWSYTFIDQDNDTIQNVEWQGKQDIYATEGSYTVKLRVQDSKGMWSNWAEKQFYVINSSGIKQIATGQSYTIALMYDGTVKSWGINSKGQLGDGTYVDKHTPVTVSDLTNVSQIFSGGYTSMALLNDGTVKAWGYNGYFQLGDGTTIEKTKPIVINGLNNVKQISVCMDHVIAVLNDGTIKAWGNNQYGQLGDGTTVNKRTPITISGISGVKQASAGSKFTMVLLNNGTVETWGVNNYGQLGNAGIDAYRSAPAIINGLNNVKQIDTLYEYSVALLEDGTVKAWGDNRYGQLGDGTTTIRYAPITVNELSNVKQISAGGAYHMVALMNDGTVKTCGNNQQGELGNGTTTGSYKFIQVPGLSGVQQISAGYGHTAVLLNDGMVKTWGRNNNGELGDGTTTDRYSPITVNGLF